MAEKQQGNETIGTGTAIVTQTKTKTQKPSMYRVLILNDDYTPMEFVVYVLERFFNKSRESATRVAGRIVGGKRPPRPSGAAAGEIGLGRKLPVMNNT